MIICGDCLEEMAKMEPNSIDSIVCDPPYGLFFMLKDWDYGIPGVHFWVEAIRVAKPGCHLLAFGGTRTFHRLACAIEDAGWKIRDCLGWLYGSGFPKSHNLKGEHEGWGTALKPAWEPIIMARKPLDGTVAANVQRWGTGAINVGECRVVVDPDVDDMLREVVRKPRESQTWEQGSGFKNETNPRTGVPDNGRWPANLLHDGSEEVMGLFPDGGAHGGHNCGYDWMKGGNVGKRLDKSSGSAARFFYCAKASRKEREMGCEGMPLAPSGSLEGGNDTRNGKDQPQLKPAHNHHPTVKPLALMRYLCRLVTPPAGTILDPFMGSGTTLIAAEQEGFRAVGIELNEEYCEIARRRTSGTLPQ